ncbi:glycosyltransferase family 15 protein [Collybia nuda]|uniref:Glycosyltransferase family 15 protein n=1 Tax=Collybia nuda TaxID=64659 RepID=A0A9P6CIL1_9AGAR|nr:glycosyltransferase family 15 protein [Collybia nuda]
MHLWARYLILVLGLFTGLHYVLRLTQDSYSQATSFENIALHLKGSTKEAPGAQSEPETYHHLNVNSSFALLAKRRANATFVILARNSDLNGTVQSVYQIEERFNKKHRYPYVFLNDEPFTEEFKQRISLMTSSLTEFGVIPSQHWNQPDWIDEEKAKKFRDKLVEQDIIYGGSVSYRNMCRFNSGFFFKQELMQKYRWYWRIEPDVNFHCDIDFDPFTFMEDNNKVYGFTITPYEFEATIPSLWGHVQDFMKQHPEYIAQDNAMGFMSNDGGEHYNLCHFWSNFEIADMEFWRAPAYSAFFNYLDSTGGFYYERWGDAPVHSLAAAMFAKKDEIHFFNEIGYGHHPFTHCPRDENVYTKGRCNCDRQQSFDYHGYSCMIHWDKLTGRV